MVTRGGTVRRFACGRRPIVTTVADIQYALTGFIIVAGVAYTAFIFMMSSKDEHEQEKEQH
jgi:hypothetical protein